MTSTYRQTIRELIDRAVRARVSWDDEEPRARRAELELAAAQGICGQCSGLIPDERLARRALFCSDLCRKRSHYAADAERVRAKRLETVTV